MEAPYVFIQWKGTDVCLDFHCVCTADDSGHFDGYFAYYLRCRQCGRIYEMPSQLSLKEITDAQFKNASIQEPEWYDESNVPLPPILL